MRVVFCSVGLRGHFNPLVPFVTAARARGDDVTIVVPPALASEAAALGVAVEVCVAPDRDAVDALMAQVPHVSRVESVLLLDGELFGRLSTEAMLPTLEALCARHRPDLIVRETCSYAGPVAAVRFGVAHAQVAISTATAEWGLLSLIASALGRFEDTLVDAIRDAPYLTRFPELLDPSPFPRTLRYREDEPVVHDTPGGRWTGGDTPLLYATLGTVAGGLDDAVASFRVLIDAVSGLGARVLVTTGRELDPDALGTVPPDTVIETYVEQADVFPEASVVVCHGGSGTTYGAIAAGLPIVFVPMFADQFTNAELVSSVGAGIVAVTYGEDRRGVRPLEPSDGPAIRAAVQAVLSDGSYRRAAARLADERRSVEDAAACLDRLVETSA